jgi:hypothetical protein
LKTLVSKFRRHAPTPDEQKFMLSIPARRRIKAAPSRDIKKTFPRVCAYDALRQKLKTYGLESLPLLDDIWLFRAVVLVDQFLVALADQASVISVCDTASAIR